MSQRLTGKVAVVTGASKGIGASIAKHLADYGAYVRLVVHDEDALQGTGLPLRGPAECVPRRPHTPT